MPRAKKPVNQKRDDIRAWFDSCDPTQTQTKDALKRAAKLIWGYQTDEEKAVSATIEHNGVGFSAFHADFASRIVHYRGTLPTPMAVNACKMLRRYALQLAKITLEKDRNSS